MEYRTLSQICGRLYLPMFLFMVGLFTLTYMAALMALAIPCGKMNGEPARILEPLVGKTIYQFNNQKEFADEIRNTKMEEGGCITSYDVTALFTAVPVPSALDLIKNRLEQDTELPNRTIMLANNIVEMLGFYLNNTYFLFQYQFFEQTKGAAMASPASLIVANIYMEALEHRTITTALNLPRIWKRYVDGLLLSNTSHTGRKFSNISTQWILPSNSLWKKLDLMIPCHSWISW